MIYGIYRLLTRLAFWFAFPPFIAFSLVTGRQRKSLKQRMGFYNRSFIDADSRPTVVWFHAASVGEVKAAGILIRKLKGDHSDVSVVLTIVTEQGFKIAAKEIGNMAECLYAPLDFPGAVSRAIERIKPSIYICLETELWPNLLKELQKRDVKMFLLNARISERSSHRYQLFKSLVSELLAGFSGIAAISGKDADRLLKLGAADDKLFVSGNVKYDHPKSSHPAKTAAHYRKVLGLNTKHTVIVAGSTHTGEEEILVRTFRDLQQKIENLVLILAPRHLSRLPDIIQEMSALNAGHNLLSDITDRGRKYNIVIIDTMGELAEIYSVADYIFCGGSLVERGGHNLLEAARWGVPVFYGPSMKDFEDARMILEENGGGSMVKSGTKLARKISELTEDNDHYKRVAEGAAKSARLQHGAAEKQLAAVMKVLREATN